MVGLKNLQVYNLNEVPEHLFKEMAELAALMLTEWQEMTRGVHSSISIGAWNFAHAALLIETFNERMLREGTKLSALSLFKNVELLMSEKGISFEPIAIK